MARGKGKVLKTETIYIDGKQWRREIRVHNNGEFSIRLPKTVQDTVGKEEVRGNSMKEVVRAFDEVQKQYNAACTTTEKVILYDIAVSARIMGTVEQYKKLFPKKKDRDMSRLAPTDEIVIFSEQEISFCSGAALAITCGVFTEYKVVRSDGSERYRYERCESGIPASVLHHCDTLGSVHNDKREKNRLVWTQQREDFFADLARAMESLILKLTVYLDTPDKVQALADTGFAGFLPLSTENVKPRGRKRG